MGDEDGEFQDNLLPLQSGDTPQGYPLTEADERLVRHHPEKTRKEVEIAVPVDEEDDTQEPIAQEEKAESLVRDLPV
jgi:hypothetical protein